MRTEDRIIRNWNIVWTVIAIGLSIGILVGTTKFNPYWSDLEAEKGVNEDGTHYKHITSYSESDGGYVSVDQVKVNGWWMLIFINVLFQFGVWVSWYHLVMTK